MVVLFHAAQSHGCLKTNKIRIPVTYGSIAVAVVDCQNILYKECLELVLSTNALV